VKIMEQPTDWIAEISTILGTILGAIALYFAGRASKIAQASADHLKNAERAWVMVSIDPSSEFHISTGSSAGEKSTSVYVTVTCRNQGGTPAWIREIGVSLVIAAKLPAKPDWNNVTIAELETTALPPGQPSTTKGVWVETNKWKEINSDEITAVFGVVRYRDVFGDERETTFGYQTSWDYKRLVPLTNYPEYNKHT
jgi:hypothetical protein